MKTSETLTSQTACLARFLRTGAAVLALAVPAVLPQTALGEHVQAWNIQVPRLPGSTLADNGQITRPPVRPDIQVPAVPSNIQVPQGSKAYRVGHAFGTQQYSCVFKDSVFQWVLFGPQATLLNDDNQVMTHFLSPNPIENGKPRPTWEDSHDTSAVWGSKIAESADPNFVASGAIKWFLLQVVGAESGPTGGARMTPTTYIQRLNTSGGVAPSGGCDQSTPAGAMALVPYTADYFFYRAVAAH